MRLGMMFRDVAEALWQPPVTQKYPFERRAAPERLRGRLTWSPEKCTGCGLCTKDCPSNAIELVVNDKKAKNFVLRYNLDQCIFCAQCTENCRFSCLTLSNTEWELAALTRKPFLYYYGKEENVQAYLASLESNPTPGEAAQEQNAG